jgi:hypothetical protein
MESRVQRLKAARIKYTGSKTVQNWFIIYLPVYPPPTADTLPGYPGTLTANVPEWLHLTL